MGQLTITEAKRLSEYEFTIRNGLNSWMAVSNAMIQVHDKQLYREKAETFEAYCKEEFGLSRQRVYQLIESGKAANVVASLVDKRVDSLSTMVDKTPPSERAIRELAKVENDLQKADLWVKAEETAPKTKDGEPNVTAAHVAKTRKAMFPPESNGRTAAPTSEPVERDDFEVELDDASDVFRLLAEQDVTAVLRRLAVLRLEFEK